MSSSDAWKEPAVDLERRDHKFESVSVMESALLWSRDLAALMRASPEGCVGSGLAKNGFGGQ